MLGCALGGCQKAQSAPSRPTGPKEQPIRQQIETGPSTLTRREPGSGTRPIAWTAQWLKARIEYVEGPGAVGDIETVSGAIYRDGKEASHFAAQRGHIDQKSGQLSLSGDVRTRSLDDRSSLRCDEMRLEDSLGIVVAKGNVHFEQQGAFESDFAELWCSRDLSVCSTPDLWKQEKP